MPIDWGNVIGSGVTAIANVWSASTNAKTQHDTLNQQSELNDNAYNYNLSLISAKTQSAKTIITVIGIFIVILLLAWAIVYSVTKRR